MAFKNHRCKSLITTALLLLYAFPAGADNSISDLASHPSRTVTVDTSIQCPKTSKNNPLIGVAVYDGLPSMNMQIIPDQDIAASIEKGPQVPGWDSYNLKPPALNKFYVLGCLYGDKRTKHTDYLYLKLPPTIKMCRNARDAEGYTTKMDCK